MNLLLTTPSFPPSLLPFLSSFPPSWQFRSRYSLAPDKSEAEDGLLFVSLVSKVYVGARVGLWLTGKGEKGGREGEREDGLEGGTEGWREGGRKGRGKEKQTGVCLLAYLLTDACFFIYDVYVVLFAASKCFI